MKRSDFDLQTGIRSVYWVLEPVEDPIDAERDSLREDLIQITLENGAIVDVGWYPDGSPDGEFTIVLVLDYDWEAPLRTARCRTLRDLHALFDEFLAQARALDLSSATRPEGNENG